MPSAAAVVRVRHSPRRLYHQTRPPYYREYLRWAVCISAALLVCAYSSLILPTSSTPRRGVLPPPSMTFLRRGGTQTSSSSSAEEAIQIIDNNNKDEMEEDGVVPITRQYYYNFWLMPCDDEKRKLQQLIDTLSIEYDTKISFEPHVTLAPPVSTIPDLTALIGQYSSNEGGASAPIITLGGLQAGYGTLYTQSVFLRFAEGDQSQQLEGLYEISKSVSGLNPSPPLLEAHFPHMSLLYSDCCPDVRQKIAGEVSDRLPLLFENNYIRFDTVQLMQIELPVEGPDDVKKWKVLGRKRLVSSQNQQ